MAPEAGSSVHKPTPEEGGRKRPGLASRQPRPKEPLSDQQACPPRSSSARRCPAFWGLRPGRAHCPEVSRGRVTGSVCPGVSPALGCPPQSPAGRPSGELGLKTGSHCRLLVGETSGPWLRGERPAEPGEPPGAGSTCRPCCSAGGVAGRLRGAHSPVRRDAVARSTGTVGGALGGQRLSACFFDRNSCATLACYER